MESKGVKGASTKCSAHKGGGNGEVEDDAGEKGSQPVA